jgi:hypothetical protein
MKSIVAHIISFFLGIAVAAAGFTILFPQVDPQQENQSEAQHPGQQKTFGEQQGSFPGAQHAGPGEKDLHGQGGQNAQNRQKQHQIPDFSPKDKPSPGNHSAPPPGR